jgi:2,4-dienoyl-CoA reductase-like NADH-dependent reductase (Old Yellow Enzyme family)
MNERIKELASKVGIHYYRKGQLQVDTENLVELIVNECIDIVAAGGEFASRPKLVEQLKEHFGVGEE